MIHWHSYYLYLCASQLYRVWDSPLDHVIVFFSLGCARQNLLTKCQSLTTKNWPRTSWDVGTLQQLKRVVLHEISKPRARVSADQHSLPPPYQTTWIYAWVGQWRLGHYFGGIVWHLTLLLGLFMHRKNTSETQEPIGDNQIFLVIAKHVHFWMNIFVD